MPKVARIIVIEGTTLVVPQYVNRTQSGWQVRVRGVESVHMADAHYASPEAALQAASSAVAPMLAERSSRRKRQTLQRCDEHAQNS
jgi:hypothetical protein